MKEMMGIGNSQPDVLAFVTESSEEMDKAVKELAVYMFLVVCRMFQKVHGKIEKTSSEEIIKCYEQNEGLMERLEGAHERFLDRIASAQTSRQPYVVHYIVDALMGEDKGEDVVELIGEVRI